MTTTWYLRLILSAALITIGVAGLILWPRIERLLSPTTPEEPDTSDGQEERPASGADEGFGAQLRAINEEMKAGGRVIDEEPPPTADMVKLAADFDAWQWELDQWATDLAVEVASWAQRSAGAYRECAALLGEMNADFIAQVKDFTVDLDDVEPASSLDAALASFTTPPLPIDDFGLLHALVDTTGEFRVVA